MKRRLYIGYENLIRGGGGVAKRDWVLRDGEGEEVWRVHTWCNELSEGEADTMMIAFLDKQPEEIELLDRDGYPVPYKA